MAQLSPPDQNTLAIGGKAGLARAGRLVTAWPAAIICVALALRLWGITWSLPDDRHFFSYHPDEGMNLERGVLDRGQIRPHLDIHFYNYGGLYFYLWQGATAVNRAYSIVRRDDPAHATIPPTETVGALLLVGRLITAVLGATTAGVVFSTGRRLFGTLCGVIAGALYAIMPAAVIHGHYATVDVPATFFVALGLAAAARLLDAVEAGLRPRAIAGAGIVCGLAAATKYNCGTVLLAPLAAIWLPPPATRSATADGAAGDRECLRERGALDRSIASLMLCACACAGFLLGCPGAMIEPAAFWRDVSFELGKSSQGMGLLFADTGNGWIYHLESSLRFGLGVPMLVAGLAAVGFAVARSSRRDWLLLAFLLPYYFMIGWAQVRFLRYVIPMYPAIAVLIARVAAVEWRARWPAIAVRACLAVAAAATLLISLAMDRLMTEPAAQDQAYTYIRTNVPRGSSIGFATTPWYYTPPLSPWFTAPIAASGRARAAREVSDYTLRVPAMNTEWDAAVLNPPPDRFALSDVESEDALRLRWTPARPIIDALRTQYSPTVFQLTPSIFGLDFGKPDYVPNDWLYIYPRVTVYTRR